MNYSSQDSPSLARGTQEGRSRFVPKFKKRARFPSSTPPGRNLLFPVFTSQPFLLPFHPFATDPAYLPKKYSHTRTGPSQLISGFEKRETRTMRCVATPRADWSRRFPFWIHGITGRRGSGASVGPHPVVLPLPLFQQSTPTGANSKPRGAQSSTGRRSHHFPRVRIHLELLSRIFFCGCLESCCSFFLFLFRVTFSINQRGRDGRRNNSRGREFYSRRIRIPKANERFWVFFREYFSNLKGTFVHFRVFEREQSVPFREKVS